MQPIASERPNSHQHVFQMRQSFGSASASFSSCQLHIVSTARNRALPLIIRAYASAAWSSG